MDVQDCRDTACALLSSELDGAALVVCDEAEDELGLVRGIDVLEDELGRSDNKLKLLLARACVGGLNGLEDELGRACSAPPPGEELTIA